MNKEENYRINLYNEYYRLDREVGDIYGLSNKELEEIINIMKKAKIRIENNK